MDRKGLEAEIERLRAKDARMHASVAHWEREFIKAQEAVEYANQRWDAEHDRAEAAEKSLAFANSKLTLCFGDLHDMEAKLAEAIPEDVMMRNTELAADLAAERAKTAKLVEALEGLAGAVRAEVNEKGGGGYILARLTGLRL